MFDAHVHIIDPRFALTPNQGYLPDPYPITAYRRRMSRFDVSGGAVVSASFQGTDQQWLRTALEELGPEWVGVARLALDASDEDILDLDRAGVRALRLNVKRAATDITGMVAQALRAYELAGWHAEIYVDGHVLSSLRPVIAKLPAVSVDHLGMSADSLGYLLELVDQGVKVKATGFGRVDMDVPKTLRRIHAVNPEALLFGTDLPGSRADRPFWDSDIALIADAVGTDFYAVMEDNARALYRLPPRPRHLHDPDPTLPLPDGSGEDAREMPPATGPAGTRPFPRV